jgi:hypothetical protein
MNMGRESTKNFGVEGSLIIFGLRSNMTDCGMFCDDEGETGMR